MIPEEVAVSKMETTAPTCSKSSQVGNEAAMRETLRTLRQRFNNNVMAYQDRYFKFSGWHWHKKAEEAARWRDVFYELLETVDAALSAPPRNCDIMDWRTAWAKWRTECHPQKPCGYAEVVSGTEQFMDWYMSEAKRETK